MSGFCSVRDWRPVRAFSPRLSSARVGQWWSEPSREGRWGAMRRCIKSLGSTVGAAFIVLAAMGRSAYADESNSSARGAWLGLFVHRLSASARERAGGWVEGAEVVRVAPGGPAQQAGIVPGDVILSIGSRNISDGDDLKTIEATLEPGTPISVALSRDNGRVIKVTNVDPAESPAREASDDAAGHAEHADASTAPSEPEASAPT